MTKVDVVVTGLGATTPLGGDVASTWDAMLAGRSGVTPLTEEWAQQLPVRIAAQLAVEPSEVIDRVKLRRLDRSEAVAIIASPRMPNEDLFALRTLAERRGIRQVAFRVPPREPGDEVDGHEPAPAPQELDERERLAAGAGHDARVDLVHAARERAQLVLERGGGAGMRPVGRQRLAAHEPRPSRATAVDFAQP